MAVSHMTLHRLVARLHPGRRTLSWVCLSLLALLGTPSNGVVAATGSGADTVDAETVDRSASALQHAIEDAVQKAGGNLELQHLHLVLGFSTGHFPKDPLAAGAARRIASDLVQNLLIQDDRLSAYAWEFGLWSYPASGTNPVQVPVDAG